MWLKMAIINPWIFYLIDVLSTLKKNSAIIVGIATFVLCCMGFIAVLAKSDSHYDNVSARLATLSIKSFKKSLIVVCVSAGIYTVIPSETTMYKILVAQYVTYENVDKATESIKEGVDYIFNKLEKTNEKR